MDNTHTWIMRDRLAGSLTGLLIGDALGVPYEFHPPQALPPASDIEFVPPAGFPRAYRGVPPRPWSDDGAQALVLLETLTTCGRLDLGHFAEGLVRWARSGFCAVDSRVFDVGIQTSRAISQLANGVPADQAGPGGERDNGNGSLMRVLPLALWHAGRDEELVQLAMRQSLPTHGHARAQLACAQYCLWVRAVLEDAHDAWETAAGRLRSVAAALFLPGAELETVLNPANAAQVRGTGYVVDTLWSARAAVDDSSDFEECVRRAISFGHDTDTTAAVAGGVAGARYGLSGIPNRWRTTLRGGETLQPLLYALLEHRLPSRTTSSAAKTSDTHPLRIAELPALAGKIGITFCPGKKQRGAISGTWDRDLDIDLAAVKAWGATHVVTLVEAYELAALRVEKLPDAARALGMQWHHLPIIDQGAPDKAFELAWEALAPELIASMRAGQNVLVHCKGGLGRAGTVVALLAMQASPDLDAAEAIRRVRSVRPGAIETRVQERYLFERSRPS